MKKRLGFNQPPWPLYYAIAKKSKVHGFPAVRFSSVGTGGIIKVTVFTIRRKLEGNLTLLQKWENISHQLSRFIHRAIVQNGGSSQEMMLLHVEFYFHTWSIGEDNSKNISRQKIAWIRKLYKEIEPYVAKSPRTQAIEHKDLDFGINQEDYSYSKAKIWGEKYFKGNFERLAKVKSKMDPNNFFRNEQSIPPY
ncbi:hypothetical protein HAX54_020483 [Datura stramonium]|uniref:Berberine/berberine-like domain-containing protein n=1 Tax=Datura stramonium TaxID=4076 RepID=A0ABS8S2J5_DATST|nr:hypothetical protein [Datura stramonium]